MTPTPGGPFRLVHSEVVREEVRTILRRALEHGIDAEVRNELQAIQDRLAVDPMDCGDERAPLPFLGLTQRYRLFSIMCVYFAVDPVRRLVYVQNYIAANDYRFLDEP